MSLDRQTILSKTPQLARERVNVPAWGGDVYVRELTAWERDSLEVSWEKTKRHNFRARLAVATVCDEQGEDLFGLKDIEALGKHPSTALVAIADVAFRVNKFTKEEVEELEKNSESGPSEGSSSE